MGVGREVRERMSERERGCRIKEGGRRALMNERKKVTSHRVVCFSFPQSGVTCVLFVYIVRSCGLFSVWSLRFFYARNNCSSNTLDF